MSKLNLAPEIEAQRPERGRGYRVIEDGDKATVLHALYTLVFHLDTGKVEGSGVGINEWFDAAAICRSCTFLGAASPEPMSTAALLACAAHQKFAAWVGCAELAGRGAK